MSTSASTPHEMEEVGIPSSLFSHLLPSISDLVELKLILYVLYLLHQKGGAPHLVTYREMSSNQGIINIIQSEGKPQDKVLHHALETASREGILLHLPCEIERRQEDLYFLNTATGRETIAQVQRNEISPAEVLHRRELPVKNEGEPNIFTLYEQNIGMLTPMIAEELREAEETYPASWIKDAFKEAVSRNKRSWWYIARILERWSSEGREYGASGRYPKEIDPDKYIKGKYGHIVRR